MTCRNLTYTILLVAILAFSCLGQETNTAQTDNTTVVSNSTSSSNDTAVNSYWEDFQIGASQSFIIIFLAELGDRTFIMVTLLSSQLNKFSLFLAASMVMTIMHTISTLIGAFFAYLIPKIVVSYLVIALFLGFGFMMLYKGCKPKSEADEEEDEKAEIIEQLEKMNILKDKQEPLLEGQKKIHDQEKQPAKKEQSLAWYQRSTWGFLIFSLMCQEWGDVSQVAAIGLAAKYGTLGIILGGSVAHILCILVALLLGVVVEKFCNERWLSIFSGMLFLSFATMEIIKVATGSV